MSNANVSEYITVTNVRAIGNAEWYAEPPSVDGGGTYGWNFSEAPEDILVTGAQALEQDTAITGLVSIVIAGAVASESDSVASGTAQVIVFGAQMDTDDSGESGGSYAIVLGSPVAETDESAPGVLGVLLPGALAASAEESLTGSIVSSYMGALAEEADSATPGEQSIVLLPGFLARVVITTQVDERVLSLYSRKAHAQYAISS